MDPEEFIDRFIRRSPKQRCLYHFTDGRNLTSIRQRGLLSTRTLEEQGIRPIYGGNEWSKDADKRFGMDEYVHLCFMQNNSMEWLARNEGRIKDVMYLEISPNVLKLPGALVTLGVSNSRDVQRLPVEEGLDRLDADVIYRYSDHSQESIDRWKLAKKCEVLVPDQITTDYIWNLNRG